MKPYYEDSAVTIYHGDNREILPTLGRFDLLLTDPPYGVEFRNEAWDKFIPDWLGSGMAVSDLVIFTTSPTTLWDYPRPDCVLCCSRQGATSYAPSGGFNHWTPLLVYGKVKFPVDFISLPALANIQPKGFEHPCPKPEKLMRWVVGHSTEAGGSVVDPFAGSGTTGRACKDLGRRCVLIEREESYCEIAARRMGQEVLALT